MKQFEFRPTNAICGLRLHRAWPGFFVYQSLTLELGTAFRMGPGYFPLVLASILIGAGRRHAGAGNKVKGEPIGALALARHVLHPARADLLRADVRGLGFVPSLFFAALIAAFASSA
jgi:hypothetical protein